MLAPDTSINLLQPMTYRNGLKESSLITELPSVSDRSITVGHVSNRPARDRRAPLLILRKKELSYYLWNNKLITSIHLMKILRLQRQRQYLLLRQIEFQKPNSQSHFQAQRDIGPVKVTSTCRTRKTSQPLIIRPFTTPESLELSKIHLKETKKSLNKGTKSGGEALVKGYDLNPDSGDETRHLTSQV